MHEALPTGEVFGKTIAYNVVAKIGDFEHDGFTGEEAKMMAEPRKILGLPDLPVVATSRAGAGRRWATACRSWRSSRGRSPWPRRARRSRPRPAWSSATIPRTGIYPSPLEAAGGDDALAGRIRQVPGRDDALVLFSCADNLRKGAALNAVQIAEHLFAR